MTVNEFLQEWNNTSDRLLVHTSGSTGTPKPLWVEKRRMEESARITCNFLGLGPGDTSLLCLSPDYIAGKMMIVRSLVRGMRLLEVKPSGHPLRGLPSVHPTIDFAAMVPLQVYNSLQVAKERECLMSIRHLIIGGGAVDDDLATELHSFPHAVWSTYGMTETLSHIALRRLNGLQRSDWYTPFDGVNVSLNADGCLVIDAPAVHDGTLVTNDMAEIREGRFRILGRKDNVICSGGIKIQMEVVEQLLHPHLTVPFMITRAKDEQWGETVVMLLEQSDVPAVRAVCQKVLPKYWQPRRFILVDRLPMTMTGKPARAEAERLAAEKVQ